VIESAPCIQRITARLKQIHSLPGHVYRVWLHTQQPVAYCAGQYLNLILDSQAYPFSIANAPGTEQIELHIRCLPGHTAAQDIIQALTTLTDIPLELAYGDVTLDKSKATDELIFLAASTGLSQLKSLIEAGFIRNPQQSMHLYWANACKQDVYLPELPREWQQRSSSFHYHPLISERIDDWEGRTGLLHEAVLEDGHDFSKTVIYACGSPEMVYGTLDGFEAAGLTDLNYYSDVFAYAPCVKSSK
jgi:CDP-4-dehydro-6-deoxyglucose reductase